MSRCRNHRYAVWIHRIVLSALCMVSAVAHADEQMAIYIEANGRTIELASDVVSPLDSGTGEIVYTAFEADDLVTPANVETVGKTQRIIGWRRAGDRIVIYQTPTETIEFPASAMKYRIVDRLNVSERSNEGHPQCCERNRRPAAS